MILNNEVCKERTQQINICVELEKYHSGAVALLDIKKMFKLSGNFSNIESLAGKVSRFNFAFLLKLVNILLVFDYIIILFIQ